MKKLEIGVSQCPAKFRSSSGSSDWICQLKYADLNAHRHQQLHVDAFGNSWVGPPFSRCQWTTKRGGRNGINFHCLYARNHRGPHKIGTGEYEPNWDDRRSGRHVPLPKDLAGKLNRQTRKIEKEED